MLEVESYGDYEKLNLSEKELFKKIHETKRFLMFVLEKHPEKIDEMLERNYDGKCELEIKLTTERIENIITGDGNLDIIHNELIAEKNIFEQERIENQKKENIEIENIVFNKDINDSSFTINELEELGAKVIFTKEKQYLDEKGEIERESTMVYKLILPKGLYTIKNTEYTYVTNIIGKNNKIILMIEERDRFFTQILKTKKRPLRF